jgi:hypothetical protein
MKEESHLVYIVWRDSVGAPHYVGCDCEDIPATILLEGVAWIVNETEQDLVVAAYRSNDGGWMDVVAIPRCAIEKIYRIQWPQPVLQVEAIKLDADFLGAPD